MRPSSLMNKYLLSDAELSDDSSVTLDILLCQIVQQYRITERRDAHLLECRRRGGRLPGCLGGRGHGEVSLYALQYGGYVARPVQPLRQVDDASSRPLAEVDSQVSGKADLE